MTAPSEGFKDKLVTAGIGTFGTGTWPIYIGKMPATPDNCITITDSGGLPPEPIWHLDYPDVSVVVRGKNYVDTRAKMKAIKDAMLGLPAQDINGDRWCGVILLGEPGHIGNDVSDRPMFSATFRLFIEPAEAAGDNRYAL